MRKPKAKRSPVIIVSVSELDGPVVQWFATTAAVIAGHALITASRNGVYVRGWTTDLPAMLIEQAERISGELKLNPGTDFARLATHTRLGTAVTPKIERAGY